ncbi:hypothetical protein NBRC10512_001962 [Rhodotorula toruloides]
MRGTRKRCGGESKRQQHGNWRFRRPRLPPPPCPLLVPNVHKLSGKSEDAPLQHTFNAGQITWHRAGSALNHMAKSKK